MCQYNGIARTLKSYAHQRETTRSSNESLLLRPLTWWEHLLRWYRTHHHMSKKLPSFDMLRNSSKLIYCDKNISTLPCFFKSYQTFKNRIIWVFQISISHILKNWKWENQGSQVRFPASSSLSDETLSRYPVFWDALKPEPLPVEPSGVPGHRTTKCINPPGQYWYSQGTRPQKKLKVRKAIFFPGNTLHAIG